MKLSGIFLCMMGCLLSVLPIRSSALAQEGISDKTAVECNADDAAQITYEDAYSDSDLQGKCVSLEGILYNGFLYADRAAIIDGFRKIDRDRPDAAEPRRWIAVTDGDLPTRSAPIRVRSYGRLSDCREDKKLKNFFALGRCQSWDTSYLDQFAITFLSSEYISRIIVEEADIGQSSLQEISKAEVPDQFEPELARLLLLAAIVRSEVGFYLLHSPRLRPDESQLLDLLNRGETLLRRAGSELRNQYRVLPVQSLTQKNWSDARSSVRGLDYEWFTSSGSKIKYFKPTVPVSDAFLNYTSPVPEYEDGPYACWCKTDDCSNK